MNELGKRLIVSAVLIAIVLAAIAGSYTFPLLFFLLGAAAIAIALYEFYAIARIKGLEPLASVGIAASILYPLAIYSGILWLPAAILFGALFATFGAFCLKGTSPLVNIAVTLLGLLYLTVPLTCLLQINFLPEGQWWLLYLILVTKCTDAGAYFGGKSFGRNKMCPEISPGKTWEGALSGVLVGVAVSFFFLPWTEALILGALLSVVGQIGDLAESLIKRDAGVKDSNSLPGLGGLLDILDSLIFTAPLLYLYLLETL